MRPFYCKFRPTVREGTPLYKLFRYVPPQRVWFLSRFGLKMGIGFDYYGLKSGIVFKGTTGAYKRICLFNSKREISKLCHSSWILPIVDFVTDAKLNYGETKVWKRQRSERVLMLEARSENWWRKCHVLVWNWVRIWGTGRHTPTENSEEYPPPPQPVYPIKWLSLRRIKSFVLHG